MADMTIEEFRERLKKAIKTGALSDAIVETGHTLAFMMERQAKHRVTGGNPLNVRSGKLRQSIKPVVREIRGGVRAGVQAGSKRVPYAAIHETGQTRDGQDRIYPKNAQYLRIPFPGGPATTRTGRDRFQQELKGGTEFQFVKLKGDKAMLVNRFTMDPWYLLVRSVGIKKRPFLEPSRNDAEKRMPRLLALKIREALRSVDLGT
jgi:hypothetical protein|tara:strand:- start:1236 stop:1850 length:615 start_codon:yes stop_codon:yes gene_type:complete